LASSQRTQRVGEQIHKEVSSLLQKGLNDPRIGFITITAVEMTSDLHLARIYFTAFGDEKVRSETLKGLNHAVPYFRREIGRQLRLRIVPELLFQIDTSIEQGNRIESILREIHDEQSDDSGHTEEN
jgi:ribosome-binding factor A